MKIKFKKNQTPTKHEMKHGRKLAKMIDERHPDMKIESGKNKGKDIKDLLNNQDKHSGSQGYSLPVKD